MVGVFNWLILTGTPVYAGQTQKGQAAAASTQPLNDLAANHLDKDDKHFGKQLQVVE